MRDPAVNTIITNVLIRIGSAEVINKQTNRKMPLPNDVNVLNINSDPGDTETVPIAGNQVRLFRRFGAMLGSDRQQNFSPEGYVEFGINDPQRSARTLGTFAGVFSPVALSMFSALLFIRVGKHRSSCVFFLSSSTNSSHARINTRA